MLFQDMPGIPGSIHPVAEIRQKLIVYRHGHSPSQREHYRLPVGLFGS